MLLGMFLLSFAEARSQEAAVALPLDAAAYRVEGKVVHEGQTLVVKTAFAEWRPKTSSLSIFLYPFELTPEELAIYHEKHDYRPLKKSSPDPAKWPGRVPWVLIGLDFSGDHGSLTTAKIKGASVSYMNFKDAGSSATTSGDGFKLYEGFRSFVAKGSAVGDTIEFSLTFQQKSPPCDIQVKGKTVIINHSKY
jgi:hypothetical protein